MVRNLPLPFLIAARNPAEENPFALLLEIEVPTTPTPTRLRLTDQRKNLKWGYNETIEDRNTYYPAGFEIGDVEEKLDGGMPELQVSIGDASLVTRQLLEDHDGLIDQPTVLRIVPMGSIENENAQIAFRGRVIRPLVTVTGVGWAISTNYDLVGRVFPGRRFVAHQCRFAARFGHGPCNYPIADGSAAYSSCSGSLADCELRGTNQVAIGYPRSLPKRFGGHKGIGRRQT